MLLIEKRRIRYENTKSLLHKPQYFDFIPIIFLNALLTMLHIYRSFLRHLKKNIRKKFMTIGLKLQLKHWRDFFYKIF